jgi:hypothetical protein
LESKEKKIISWRDVRIGRRRGRVIGLKEETDRLFERFYYCTDYDRFEEKGYPIDSGKVDVALRILRANDWWNDFRLLFFNIIVNYRYISEIAMS